MQNCEVVGPYIELKCKVLPGQMGALEAHLHHYLEVQKDYGEGINATLYFDTADLKSFQQGVEGQGRKTKIRLRTYEDTVAGVSHAVEFKRRVHQAVYKRRVRLLDPLSEVPSLTEVFSQVQPETLAQLLVDFNDRIEDYAPKLNIRYRRKRFLCPEHQLRLNLDTSIEGVVAYKNSWIPVCRLESFAHAILEIKGTRVPQIPNFLKGLVEPLGTISKYGTLMERYPEIQTR